MHKGAGAILLLIAFTSLCDTINQLFLKSAIDNLKAGFSFSVSGIAKFIFKIIVTPRVWIGFVFSVISLCVWLFVLSRSDLNFAFSADSMHYIFIAIASGFILKEKGGLKRWLGTGLIVLGIILVSLS